MKKYIKASYEDKFWDLHDSGYDIGIALEKIIDSKGLDILFFPEDGEPEATEDDYREVLEAYEGSGNSANIPSIYEALNEVRNALQGSSDVKRVTWLDDIEAMRFTLTDGHTYQLVLQDLAGM